MPNLLLLCHGGLVEHSAFDLAVDQCVQYRGNYGSLLTGAAARSIIQAILSDPLVTDAQITASIPNYDPHLPLEGPGTFAPDISFSGDDALMCFIMNQSTGRWLRLGSGWRVRLSALIRSFGDEPLWLNLLCCTLLPEADVPAAIVDPALRIDDWAHLLR